MDDTLDHPKQDAANSITNEVQTGILCNADDYLERDGAYLIRQVCTACLSPRYTRQNKVDGTS